MDKDNNNTDNNYDNNTDTMNKRRGRHRVNKSITCPNLFGLVLLYRGCIPGLGGSGSESRILFGSMKFEPILNWKWNEVIIDKFERSKQNKTSKI